MTENDDLAIRLRWAAAEVLDKAEAAYSEAHARAIDEANARLQEEGVEEDFYVFMIASLAIDIKAIRNDDGGQLDYLFEMVGEDDCDQQQQLRGEVYRRFMRGSSSIHDIIEDMIEDHRAGKLDWLLKLEERVIEDLIQIQGEFEVGMVSTHVLDDGTLTAWAKLSAHYPHHRVVASNVAKSLEKAGYDCEVESAEPVSDWVDHAKVTAVAGEAVFDRIGRAANTVFEQKAAEALLEQLHWPTGT